jgi:hypothetical protein
MERLEMKCPQAASFVAPTLAGWRPANAAAGVSESLVLMRQRVDSLRRVVTLRAADSENEDRSLVM